MEEGKTKKIILYSIITVLSVAILVVLILILVKIGTKTVTISFNTGTETRIEEREIERDSKTELPVITREGYTFLGWYVDDVKIENDYIFNKNTVVVAKWELNVETVIVRFDTNGGSTVDSISLKKGDPIVLPAYPSKNGYNCAGWYDISGRKYQNGDKINDNLTLYAKWNEALKRETKIEDNKTNDPKIDTFIVSFNTDGGSSVNNITVNCGNNLPVLPTPTKNGYKFIAWNDINGKVISGGASLTCENITLYAKWESINQTPKTFKVTFDTKGGNTINDITVNCGSKLENLPTPTKNGYKFIAWNDINGKAILNGASLTCEDITLYATWEKEKTSYTITFDSKGGTSFNPITVKCGDKIPNLPKPVKSGNYVFAAWLVKNIGAINSGQVLSTCEDITAVAQWGQYTIPENPRS